VGPRDDTLARRVRTLVRATAALGAFVLAAMVVAGARPSPVSGRRVRPLIARADHVSVWTEVGVVPSLGRAIAFHVAGLRARIGRDFEARPRALRIEMYATHRSFARALWREQKQRPQTALDDTSNITHDTLLVGPVSAPYLWHNLAHVYTEWVMDGITGNRSDALPPDPWLYDGLAEYEAHRYAPKSMPCSVGSAHPLDVTDVRTAKGWLALRSGPMGSLEYCLASIEVTHEVKRRGWHFIVRALHRQHSWPSLAMSLEREYGFTDVDGTQPHWGEYVSEHVAIGS